MTHPQDASLGSLSPLEAKGRGGLPAPAGHAAGQGAAAQLRQSQRWMAFLVAFSVSFYVYLMVRGAPVFPLCLLVPGIFCLGLLPTLGRITFNPLVAIYAAYLLWPLVSFPFATVFVANVHGWSVLQYQLTSIVYFYVCAAPVLVGYHLGRFRGAELWPLLRGFKLGLVLNVGFVFAVFFYYFPDMYLSRAIVKQRLPLIICYVSTVLLVCGPALTRYARVLAFGGVAAVAIALSRASFLQFLVSLAACAAVFPTVFLRMIWRQKSIVLLALAVVGILAVTQPDRVQAVAAVVEARFAALVAPHSLESDDYSASVRIEIWRSLAREIRANPASYIWGFGQLGPSFIGGSFTSSEGEVIADYSAHNQYLDTIVRAGVPGVATELLLMLGVIYFACMGCFRDPAQKRFALANGIALIGVFVFGMFHETLRWSLFAGLFWLFAGWLAAAVSFRPRRLAA